MASAIYKYYQGDVYDPEHGIYISPEARREQNLFIEEYYCSTDTRIYIEDMEQTEIAYINYSLQEQLKPLYGYASNTFDDVAIGNRIVTGMLKIPIKNPEAQTDIQAIFVEGNGLEDIMDYNNQQEELKNAIEWIDNNKGSNEENTNSPTDKEESSSSKPVQPPYKGDGSPNPDSGKEIEDEEQPTLSGERLDYLQKLEFLGYDVTQTSDEKALSKALEKFQQKQKLSEVNGYLTSETKEAIDTLYSAKKEGNGQEMKVSADTELRNCPTDDNSGVICKVKKGTKCTILDKDGANGYAHVELKNGTKGYIKKELLE